MRVTLEGLNCSGKTTLQNELNNCLGNQIRVLLDFPKLLNEQQRREIEFLRQVRTKNIDEEIELQRKWFPYNRMRLEMINESLLESVMCFSHRDFLSFYVHGYARFQGDFEAGRFEFAEILKEFVSGFSFNIVADFTLVLYSSYDEFEVRALRRTFSQFYLLHQTDYFVRANNAYKHAVKIIGTQRSARIESIIPPTEIALVCVEKMKQIRKPTKLPSSENQRILSDLIESLVLSDKEKEQVLKET